MTSWIPICEILKVVVGGKLGESWDVSEFGGWAPSMGWNGWLIIS